MRRRVSRLACLIALPLCLAGCLPFVLRIEDFHHEQLEALKGASEAAVIEEIGAPTYRITENQATYLVYQGRVAGLGGLIVLYIPVPLDVADEAVLACAKLEFRDDALKEFQIKTRSLFKIDDCRRLFWFTDNEEHISPYIGGSKEDVTNTFGEPAWEIWDKTTEYLVYKRGRDWDVACVSLDFGDENALRRYDIKSCGVFDCPTIPKDEVHPVPGWEDCRQMFWSLEELEKMVRRPKRPPR